MSASWHYLSRRGSPTDRPGPSDKIPIESLPMVLAAKPKEGKLEQLEAMGLLIQGTGRY